MRKYLRIRRISCPSCGAGVSKRLFSTSYKCSYCGNTFLIDNENEINNKEQKKKESNVVVIILAIVAMLIFIKVLFSMEDGKSDNISGQHPTTISSNTAIAKEEGVDFPEDEYMQNILSLIFNKPFEEVTKEEICSIKYFDISSSFEYSSGMNKYKYISYSFSDYHDYDTYADFEDTINSIKLPEDELVKNESGYRDMTCLKGLNACPYLTLTQIIKYEDSFQNITAVYTSNYETHIKELKQYMKNHKVDMLTVGGVSLVHGVDSTYSWLSDCKDLESLVIDMREINELPKVLGDMQKLKNLVILNAENINSLEVISKLKNLKYLKLEEARELKGIQDLKDLDLKCLDLECYELRDFSALKNNASIERLKLVTSYENASFAPVATMKNVKNLDIDVAGFTEYEKIGDLSTIEELKIKVFDTDKNLEFLSGLTNLKEAEFIGCTFNGDLSMFSKAYDLKKVKFSGGDANYNTMSLDEIPNLEDVTIELSVSEILFLEELLANNKLKKLEIKGGEIWYNEGMENNNSTLEEISLIDVMPIDKQYNEINFDVYFQEICKIDTLKKLTVNGCNLEDISGISKLNKLEKLDLSNNYIKEADEIGKLNELKELRIYNNVSENLYYNNVKSGTVIYKTPVEIVREK